jgi:hypothetical protein
VKSVESVIKGGDTMRTWLFFVFTSVAFLLLSVGGCEDAGTDPPPAPEITSVVPDSAAVGDTIRILGKNFGGTKGTSTLTIGGQTAHAIILWSDTEIRAVVPTGALTGTVRITVGTAVSNSIGFKIISSTPPSLVSFSGFVLPIFQARCIGCHGGTNNLFLNSHGQLMQGNSTNGPVVIPGNGEGSYLVRMLRGTVAGKPRMPDGGPYLATSTIDSVSLWISQGALSN